MGGYANISLSSPLVFTSGQSVALTLVADVASSTNGSMDLGIGGGNGNYATMSPAASVYGNVMTVPVSLITKPKPVPLQSSASDNAAQTAIMEQSLQAIQAQVDAILKSL